MAGSPRVTRRGPRASLHITGAPIMKYPKGPKGPKGPMPATIAAAIGIAVSGCSPDTHYAAAGPKCGSSGGGIAGLPAPAPIWTHAQADAIYFAPRGVDLDGDGRLEIIVTGGNEMPATGEVVALDGATGAVRWRATADTQLYSSPVFLDVTGDGVLDVFVGGRLEAFMAVDGASGDVLWRFEDPRALPEYYFYNFYTPFLIPDQTGDGVPDLFVANGGGDGIRPGEARPPGHLAVLNAVDGSLVAVAVLPDHQETYMSPICFPTTGPPRRRSCSAAAARRGAARFTRSRCPACSPAT